MNNRALNNVLAFAAKTPTAAEDLLLAPRRAISEHVIAKLHDRGIVAGAEPGG